MVARSVINVGPARPNDNSVIIVASGKCNNAPEFEPFAARLDFETMLYARDDGFDIDQWRREVSTSKDGSTRVDPRILRQVLAKGQEYERQMIVEILKDEPAELQKTRAYEIIKQATARKILRFNKMTKTYALV
jgi:hypothetical protein